MKKEIEIVWGRFIYNSIRDMNHTPSQTYRENEEKCGPCAIFESGNIILNALLNVSAAVIGNVNEFTH